MEATIGAYEVIDGDGVRTAHDAIQYSPFAVAVQYTGGTFTVTGVNFAEA